MDDFTDEYEALIILDHMIEEFTVFTMTILSICSCILKGLENENEAERSENGERSIIPLSVNPIQYQIDNINRLVKNSDVNCLNLLRMDRRTFSILCSMLRVNCHLSDSRHVSLEEKVVIFLNVLAHHVKNRGIRYLFYRSGETISRYFNVVLTGVVRLHGTLLKSPNPVTPNCLDARWSPFQNCLGALDGTFIRARVPYLDKPRYRTRKGEIATNVLGVCSQDMNFIYVLPGWEGSAADSRVLRDAITRPDGLKVPICYYYLVDAGYTNGEGFLAPYRGQHYHLSLWREGGQPRDHKEFFNMKHSQARNVIERCFGLLKLRWAILRSPSYFPTKTHNRIIIACTILHNLIRGEMPLDPLEEDLNGPEPGHSDLEMDDLFDTVETSDEWTEWRNGLAIQMYNQWRAARNQGHGE